MVTLESILMQLDPKRPFLKKAVRDEDGHIQPFTTSGSKAYSKLTKIIYDVGELCEVDSGVINDIIETLDAIATEQY